MYNPYENNNQPTNDRPINDAPINSQPTENKQVYGPVYGQDQPYNYTWGTVNVPKNNVTQVPFAPVKPPKKKSKTGIRILSLVLCCLISSAATVGAFVALVNTGTIQFGNSGGGSAFTISKVADSENLPVTSGDVNVLTRQRISEKLIPSVVCIQNFQIMEEYEFAGSNLDKSQVSPIGEGSGVVMSEDGYILTNAHVIDGATSLKVVMSDGTSFEATVVGSDRITDIAVVKVNTTGLTPAEFGSADDLKIADEVIAIGNPGGLSFNSSVTVGYVSALNREVSVGEAGYSMSCIQTDAAINPGNSGGALVNQYGQVVGINSSKISAVDYEGLGFAIPSETFQPIVSDLIKYGYVKDRAMLGISGQFIDAMIGRFYGLSAGMYVSEVTSSNAVNAGLQKGDIITAIDDVTVTSQATVTSVVTTKKPGDKVELVVDRALDGKKGIKITVTLSQYEKTATPDSRED